MSYVLDGVISVSWTDVDGRTVQSPTATATVTSATPTGTETLTELSRTAYIYDDCGRTAKVRQYFDLTGLDPDDVGTEGTNYYETEYLAYENLGRVLRVQAPNGDITATVYDPAGRAVEQWVGTNAANATSTDPSGGATGGINMVKISDPFYDTNGDGTGTPTERVTQTVQLKPLATLAGTTADYIGVEYEYDTLWPGDIPGFITLFTYVMKGRKLQHSCSVIEESHDVQDIGRRCD